MKLKNAAVMMAARILWCITVMGNILREDGLGFVLPERRWNQLRVFRQELET